LVHFDFDFRTRTLRRTLMKSGLIIKPSELAKLSSRGGCGMRAKLFSE